MKVSYLSVLLVAMAVISLAGMVAAAGGAPPTTPDKPTSKKLSVKSDGTHSFKVVWDGDAVREASDDVTEWQIRYRSRRNKEDDYGDYVRIKGIFKTKNAKTLNNLPLHYYYKVQVRAMNGKKASAWSKAGNVKKFDDPELVSVDYKSEKEWLAVALKPAGNADSKSAKTITHYQIKYRISADKGTTWSSWSKSTREKEGSGYDTITYYVTPDVDNYEGKVYVEIKVRAKYESGKSSKYSRVFEENWEQGGEAGFCPPLGPATGNTITVSPSQIGSLRSTLAAAAEGDTFLMESGTYNLGGGLLQLITRGVTLRSVSGNPDDVIIDNNWQGGSILEVMASDVTVADITLQRSVHHPIHVKPSSTSGTTTGTLIYNVKVIDPGQQAIKVNTRGKDDPNTETTYADDGILACSTMQLTDAGRPHVSGCYTGGIDCHQSKGWVVRDNYINGFWCESGLSEHGVHFWNGPRDTIVKRNLIVDNTRGIGFGLGSTVTGHRPNLDMCDGTPAQHYGGKIFNNVIFNSDPRLFTTQFGFDTGIGLENACDVEVYHNTVWSTTSPYASIDVRFPATSGVIANNLLVSSLVSRSGPGDVTYLTNLDDATSSWFVDAAAGDLHLVAAATKAVNGGSTALTAEDDYDGKGRVDGSPDVGAFEY